MSVNMCKTPEYADRGMGVSDQDVSELALYAGHILLESGAELSRVEDTIKRIHDAYGVDSEEAFVLSNGIFLTSGSADKGYYAKVEHIPITSAHLDRVAAVNQLSRRISEGAYTVPEAMALLKEIYKSPEKPKAHQILASGTGSGAFCVLFGGGVLDMVSAFIVGILLYVAILYPLAHPMSKIVKNLLCGAFAAGCAMFLYFAGTVTNPDAVIGASIIPLIPGVAFTTGIKDFGNQDYISGSVRIIDSLLVVFSVALGVGIVISAFHNIFGLPLI